MKDDISVMINDVLLNCRVCAIIKYKDKYLMHKDDNDDFWICVGGRIKTLENSKDALIRECKEELGVDLKNIKFITLIENFFTYDNRKFHEYNFVYYGEADFENDNEFTGLDNDMTYKFFTLEELNNLNIKPDLLKGKFDKLEEFDAIISESKDL